MKFKQHTCYVNSLIIKVIIIVIIIFILIIASVAIFTIIFILVCNLGIVGHVLKMILWLRLRYVCISIGLSDRIWRVLTLKSPQIGVEAM